MKGLEILDLVNLETNVRVGIHGSPCRPPKVNDLVIIHFKPVKLDPDYMMLRRIGMRHLMADNHTNDVHPFLVPLVYRYGRDVFLLAFIFFCFDGFRKVNVTLLS